MNCTRHLLSDYVSAPHPTLADTFTVHCKKCGKWLGNHPAYVETANKNPQQRLTTKRKRKAG